MKIIEVDLGDRKYPIYIGESVLSDKKLLNKNITSSQVLIITNENVAPLYLKHIEKNLDNIKHDVLNAKQ